MFSTVSHYLDGYRIVPQDLENGVKHISKRPIVQGDYRGNKSILEYLLSDKSQKKGHIKEVFRKEGVNFAIDATVTAGVTAATYFLTTWVLSKTAENTHQIMQLSENPTEMQKMVNAFLADPVFQKELANFMVKAQVAAGIGSSLIITQAFSSAFSKLGTSVSELLKALCHPQEGKEHEAEIKLLAFRNILEKAEPALRDLPIEIRIKATEALEDLKSTIHQMTSSAFATDANEVKKAADKLFLYFALPLKVEDTYQMGVNGDPKLAAEFDKEQEKLVRSFDEPLASQLDYIMTLHRYSTVNQTVLPINVWMEGPTAVGKTFFVEQMTKVCHDTLRKMTIYQYLQARGQTVDRKEPRVRWKAPHLEALGPWRNMVENAKTLNAANLMDEVKFFDSGDKDNNLDAVEPLKKARNPGNIPEVPLLDVKLNVVDINFFNSNYPMELPLPDKVKDPEGYAMAKTAHEAFVKSFIHIKFKNWSPEKLAERLDEKVYESLDAMVKIHTQPVLSETRKVFEELKPIILKQAALHNPSREETKITLKEVAAVVNKLSVSCALQLDATFNLRREQQGARASSENIERIELSEKQKQGLVQTIVDDFNTAAAGASLKESQFSKGKVKTGTESKNNTLSAKDVLPQTTDEEIIAEMRMKIDEIKAMAKNAATRELVDQKVAELKLAQQKEMEILIASAVADALKAGEGASTGLDKAISNLNFRGHNQRSDQPES